MLARVVENVYWLSRYLERAENTARIIGVNTNLLLDLPGGIAPGWLPLVDISGNRAEFDTKGTKGEERDVVNFLIADKENPGSICSSLTAARENARTLREILPWLRESTGFRGIVRLATPDRSKSITITLWADESAMLESAEAAQGLGALAAEASGSTRIALDDCEVTFFEGELSSKELSR